MKKILILFFLLLSCSLNKENKETYLPNLNFSDDLTIEEFKVKLKQYAINKQYPNINN